MQAPSRDEEIFFWQCYPRMSRSASWICERRRFCACSHLLAVRRLRLPTGLRSFLLSPFFFPGPILTLDSSFSLGFFGPPLGAYVPLLPLGPSCQRAGLRTADRLGRGHFTPSRGPLRKAARNQPSGPSVVPCPCRAEVRPAFHGGRCRSGRRRPRVSVPDELWRDHPDATGQTRFLHSFSLIAYPSYYDPRLARLGTAIPDSSFQRPGDRLYTSAGAKYSVRAPYPSRRPQASEADVGRYAAPWTGKPAGETCPVVQPRAARIC